MTGKRFAALAAIGCAALAGSALSGSALSGSALAEDFDWPARKPGQWDLVIESAGRASLPAMSMQMCLDAASDKGMMEAGMAMSKSLCPQQTIVKEGETIVVTSTCEVGGIKVAGRTEVSGDFQSEYTMTVKTDVSGGPADVTGATEMVHKAHWVSADCKDGMEPGDLLMPGGIKMNMMKMIGMMEKLGIR